MLIGVSRSQVSLLVDAVQSLLDDPDYNTSLDFTIGAHHLMGGMHEQADY